LALVLLAGVNMITLELLQKLCPKTKRATLEQYVEPLQQVCEYYEMNTKERVASFLAQLLHESGHLTAVIENLNYSAKGLNTTFRKYFPTIESAIPYERKPDKIANKVYANRMNNGDEASGDGAKFKGRGAIQLTGKANYVRFAADLGISLDECVTYMETAAGAISSAGWYWDQNNLNALADRGDIVAITKRVNGGTIGLTERTEIYHHALDLLD
jgi:putative chitinase